MPVLLLDGGMGTTLEALGHDVSGTMWGSELVARDPDVIASVHARFAAAGADIIETATYQMTLPALVEQGYSEEDARTLMRRAVALADVQVPAEGWTPASSVSSISSLSSFSDVSSLTSCCSWKTFTDAIVIGPAPAIESKPLRRPLQSTEPNRSTPPTPPTPSTPTPVPKPKVALSLGPFGATLSPGQEYAGLYPPPYGPAGSASVNASNYAPPKDECAYEAALTTFHLDRLRIYASDEATWSRITCLAFETIPVLREIRAIRRAVAALNCEMEASQEKENKFERKPFWIASAYPDGHMGQRGPTGKPVEMSEIAAALLGELAPLAALPIDTRCRSARPDGIGVNCTHPILLPAIIGALSGAVTHYVQHDPPWLVVYPDGGARYDVIEREWTDREMAPGLWADRLIEVVHEAEGMGMWRGVIVGGCCKSSFEEVRALRRLVDRPSEKLWERSVGGVREVYSTQI
ncbi:hypothetical protein CspeluHIS016_0407650 [Cutaneotrichosporon spelunceum]|uniref:Hcy-binding domain-containing protein n=1 Tax=Cutaneotrichosporon spelunceum TaxID=1672016 RepID=A0AAD3TWL4_9TREE|nr:hypothetical protein CspeluHIS016_0407650 [Cutaneotrichosporon spelunceum]